MKHLGGIQRIGLVVGLAFVGVGLFVIIHPVERVVTHPVHDRHRSISGSNPTPEYVTKNGSRVYGVISVAVGVGLMWMSLSGARKP